MVYGYCRISTSKQNISRQITNIKSAYPDAVIIQEEYTGKIIERPKFTKLLSNIKSSDTIVFDEVSRMSRNAEEGFNLYQKLYTKGVNLVFLKEPYINTLVYKERVKSRITALTTNTGSKATDTFISSILNALNDYTMDLVKEQIELAFLQAQKELEYLHKRTSEGVRRAQAEGKKIGRQPGKKIETRKAKEAKPKIISLSKDFKGQNTDKEVMKILGLSRNTYYNYKAELKTGFNFR